LHLAATGGGLAEPAGLRAGETPLRVLSRAGAWQLSAGGFYLLVARKIVVGLRPVQQVRREPMGKLVPMPVAKVNRKQSDA